MPSFACSGWRPSSNALMKPTIDSVPLRTCSSFRIRAFKYIRHKLAASKNVANQENRGNQEYRLRFLTGSPPPPLGQALGPDERVRTNILYDDYGFDDMLSSDEEDHDVCVTPATELSLDPFYYLRPSGFNVNKSHNQHTHHQQAAESIACFTASSTRSWASDISSASEAPMPYPTVSFDSRRTSSTSDHNSEYSISSVSNTSLASEAVSFSDSTSTFLSSPPSSGVSSSVGASIIEGVVNITALTEDSPIGRTCAIGESFLELSPKGAAIGGSPEHEGDMFFVARDSDSWSIISIAQSSEGIQNLNDAAAVSRPPDPGAITEKLGTWLDTAANPPINSISSISHIPLRVHPRFAAVYGNDPNWAFWT
ncbi:hypothetical protein GQX73_g480 [Xylaria multiplex]|uniref:Uncharacterized protein n=1 Tax=Xylaria multiplex TaxID=323545 RepID=A0A7C8MZ94_9PEZI|nr:hypothetical protein GQX73_g480 [Xylaria multiplex]